MDKKCDLCIPKLNSNVPKQFIVETLQKINIGTLERITELPLKQNPLFKRILFTIVWNEKNPRVNNIKNRLIQNETIKLIPKKDEPNFWIIMQSCCPGK